MHDDDEELPFHWSRVAVRALGMSILGALAGCVTLSVLYALVLPDGPHGAPIGVAVGAAIGIPAGAVAGVGLSLRSTAIELTVRDDSRLDGAATIMRRIAKALFVVAAALTLAPPAFALF